MSVGVLLVTHDDIGAQLSQVACAIYGLSVEPVARISIPADLQPGNLGEYADRVREAVRARDAGGGVLVLTDAFGATPDNLARLFAADASACVVSGINLPMLLRVLNYAGQTLGQLCETALVGGRTGVLKDRE